MRQRDEKTKKIWRGGDMPIFVPKCKGGWGGVPEYCKNVVNIGYFSAILQPYGIRFTLY